MCISDLFGNLIKTLRNRDSKAIQQRSLKSKNTLKNSKKGLYERPLNLRSPLNQHLYTGVDDVFRKQAQ